MGSTGGGCENVSFREINYMLFEIKRKYESEKLLSLCTSVCRAERSSYFRAAWLFHRKIPLRC
jgi:hypothetical protein